MLAIGMQLRFPFEVEMGVCCVHVNELTAYHAASL
jgi:hypothetical protein